MIIVLGLCLLVTLLEPSCQHPIPDLDPEVKKTGEDKPIYLERDELDDEEFKQKGDQSVQALSAEAADTINKINPLTIADQVSQRFRKGNQKSETKASLVSSQGNNLRVYNPQGDQNVGLLSGSRGEPKEEEPMSQQGYIQQQVPKIVHKPLTDDFGYSVIVMAGDAANLPINVQDKTAQKKPKAKPKVDDRDAYLNVQGQGFFKVGDAEERIAAAEKSNRKEVRVPKEFKKAPEFPLYDEDFSFIPDPFHGLLDENYWKEPDTESVKIGQPKPAMPVENLKLEEAAHKVNRRSETSVKNSRAAENQMSCGGYLGKPNSTFIN